MCSILAEADKAQARECAARGDKLRLVAELLSSDEWHGNGARDLASFLAARWQLSGRDAREMVREASALKERPPLQRALIEGSISASQCKALQTLCDEGNDDAEVWLENLKLWSITDLEREARKKVARELERKDDGVYLRTFHTKDERYLRGEFQLHPEDGATVVAAIDAFIPANTSPRDLDHASAKALVELARSPHAAPPIVLSLEDDLGSLTKTDGFVGKETLERLSCDARLQSSPTKTSRTISPALRRAVEARDHGMCVFPGCEMAAFLECHHIVHYADGGPTSLENLVLLCWKHHTLVHEDHWGLTGDGGPNITWLRPDGTIFEPRVRVTLDTS
jgi:hypothetical protein